ncbi:MAG: glucose-phosphate thymidylyltransferase [Candidatus Peribacteria bacterium]|nr:glucose-phosphate thymidylyltransferase [Candidatus Peribacteria bacterium]
MIAYILAGGFATRLWPLCNTHSKAFLPLAGKPLLSHIVEKIPVDMPIIVNINLASEDAYDDWRQTVTRPNVSVIIEQAKTDETKLGALGALAKWAQQEKINEDILLLTGDNYFGFVFEDFLRAYTKGTPLIAAYDLQDIKQASAFGTVILNDDGKTVIGFEEKPAEPKTSIISTGCSILPASVLPALVDYAHRHHDNIGGIFEELLRQHTKLEAFVFTDTWFDVGSFESYMTATMALVGENVRTGEAVAMDPETKCEGSVVIGSGSIIRNSTLKDVVIFESCMIDDCRLEHCVIDRNCILRGVDLERKMLMAETKLEGGK